MTGWCSAQAGATTSRGAEAESTAESITMIYAINRRLPILLATLVVLSPLLLTGAPIAAHEGPVPAEPTGLTAMGFHGGIALMPEIASPYGRLSWDDPGDTGITHYRILRRDVDTHKKGQFIVIDGNTGSSQTQYLDRSVKNDKRYVYRIVGVNEHGESGQSRSAKADTYLVAIAPFPGLDDTSPRD